MNVRLTLFLYLLCICGTSFSQTGLTDSILSCSKKGYLFYLNKIPIGKEQLYGFNNRGEFESVNVGKPIRVFTLNNKFYSDSVIIKDKNYLIATQEWRVPLLVHGEFRVLITVSNIHGGLRVVGLGGVSLSHELQEFYSLHGSSTEYGILLRIYDLVSDFILIPSNTGSSFNAFPLTSAKIALGEGIGTEIELNKLLQEIKVISIQH